MKKYLSMFFVIALFSCENTLNINDEWIDIPIVYAIFNSGTQEDADGSGFADPTPFTDFNYDGDDDPDYNNTHFVRVQKSFLGSESAYNYTSVSDSIYYNPENLSVWIELVDPIYNGNVAPAQVPLQLLNETNLDEMGIEKDDGLFNSDNYYLYKILTYQEAIEWGLNIDPNWADATDLCQGDCDNNKGYKSCKDTNGCKVCSNNGYKVII